MNKPNIIPPLGRFEAHPARILIQDWLRQVPVGDVVTYADLNELVGFDVRTESRHLIQYARDVLIDEAIVFDVVIGVGLKRATNSNAVAIVEGQGRRALGAANKGSRIGASVNVDDLTPAEQMRFGVATFRNGLVRQFGRTAIGRKIGKALEAGNDTKKLSSAVVGSLEQFK